jgi:hypothetical protein
MSRSAPLVAESLIDCLPRESRVAVLRHAVHILEKAGPMAQPSEVAGPESISDHDKVISVGIKQDGWPVRIVITATGPTEAVAVVFGRGRVNHDVVPVVPSFPVEADASILPIVIACEAVPYPPGLVDLSLPSLIFLAMDAVMVKSTERFFTFNAWPCDTDRDPDEVWWRNYEALGDILPTEITDAHSRLFRISVPASADVPVALLRKPMVSPANAPSLVDPDSMHDSIQRDGVMVIVRRKVPSTNKTRQMYSIFPLKMKEQHTIDMLSRMNTHGYLEPARNISPLVSSYMRTNMTIVWNVMEAHPDVVHRDNCVIEYAILDVAYDGDTCVVSIRAMNNRWEKKHGNRDHVIASHIETQETVMRTFAQPHARSSGFVPYTMKQLYQSTL